MENGYSMNLVFLYINRYEIFLLSSLHLKQETRKRTQSASIEVKSNDFNNDIIWTF